MIIITATARQRKQITVLSLKMLSGMQHPRRLGRETKRLPAASVKSSRMGKLARLNLAQLKHTRSRTDAQKEKTTSPKLSHGETKTNNSRCLCVCHLLGCSVDVHQLQTLQAHTNTGTSLSKLFIPHFQHPLLTHPLSVMTASIIVLTIPQCCCCCCL